MGQYTLPHTFSRLGRLKSLSFALLPMELVYEPGWGMPSLERLRFFDCRGGFLVPGLDACTRLTELTFSEDWSEVSVPANPPLLPSLRAYKYIMATHSEPPEGGLDEAHHCRLLAVCISRMRDLETLEFYHPAFASFPNCLSILRGLQTLTLGFRCVPVVTLPGAVTSLSRLSSLTLGFRQPEEWRVEGTLNVAALGSLAAFPRLKELCFTSCVVEVSEELAHAQGHAALLCVEFWLAYPAGGHHMRAVLAVHRSLLRRGRPGVSVEFDSLPTVEDSEDLEDLGEEGYALVRHVSEKYDEFKDALSKVEQRE